MGPLLFTDSPNHHILVHVVIVLIAAAFPKRFKNPLCQTNNNRDQRTSQMTAPSVTRQVDALNSVLRRCNR